MLTQDNFIRSQLVAFAWPYAKEYGHIAGQMVMSCIANRVRVGWGSWLQVLDRVPLFSAENEVPKTEYPAVWDASFVKLLHAVEGIYDGSTQDLSRGALYFGDLRKIEREWFKMKIIASRKIDEMSGSEVPVHQRVADMNTLSFWD